MKFPLPRPVFPGLVISPADEAEFTELVNVFIDKLLTEEHAFRFTNAGKVDATKWKHIRQTEDAAVYHGRDLGEKVSSATAEEGSSKRGSHRSLPSFLVVGKVPDALDDILFSFTAPTRASSIVHSSYVDPNIADVEVLHTIRSPTPEDPFSQVAIKWMVLVHSPIIAPRDYVYIEAHGTRLLSSGERIGYRFYHTIQLTGAGLLTDLGFVRSNFSTSTVFRVDDSSGYVHEYGRFFFAPAGAIPQRVFVALVARQISSTASQSRIGECRKLAHALRHKETGKWIVAVPPPIHAAQKSECGMCYKSLNLINKSRFDCALCERRLCTSCRVRKELSFIKPDMNAERLRVTFCAFCVQQAIKVPSRAVATEEYLTRHHGFYCMPASFRSDNTPRARTVFANLFYPKVDGMDSE